MSLIPQAKFWSSAETTIYDIFGNFNGSPGPNQVVQRYVMPRMLNITQMSYTTGTAPTSSAIFDLFINGALNTSISIDTTTSTMPLSAAFNTGDVLTLQAPSTPDATLADIAFTFSGVYIMS